MMNGQYTKYPADLTETVQMNAGVIVDGFTPATGVIGNILGATNSGITFDPHPSYEDLGEDIDNLPANTWQMKRVKGYDPVLSGTFRTVTASLVKLLSGAGAFDAEDAKRFIPDHALKAADFRDIWVIGDYSSHNSGTGATGTYAGYIAIHLKNALNAGGFRWKSNRDGKGEFAFEFHGHYDLQDPDGAPFEVYVRAGASA